MGEFQFLFDSTVVLAVSFFGRWSESEWMKPTDETTHKVIRTQRYATMHNSALQPPFNMRSQFYFIMIGGNTAGLSLL